MKRLLISCGLVFLVSACVSAQSTSGTAASLESPTRWATPNEIKALSYAMSLAEIPMTFPQLKSDVWGDLKPRWIFSVGVGGNDETRRHWALTDASDDKPYYGIVLRTKRGKDEQSDDVLVSMQLYYCDEHGMRFYDQGDEGFEHLKEDFRRQMKELKKTPWQMGVWLVKNQADFELVKYETNESPTGKGLVDRKYSIPFIDARVDSVIYPAEAKVPEPKKVAEPKVLFPLGMKRSAISGKVVLCVKIDEAGYAVRIAVKESTNEVFDRYAIAHALQTVWESSPKYKNDLFQTAWFESEVVFDVEKL